MEPQSLVVGVIAGSLKQLGELTRLVRGAGYAVTFSVEVRSGLTPVLQAVDVWVANLDFHEEAAQTLFDELDAAGTSIIYEDDLQLLPVAGHTEQPTSPVLIRQQKERRLAAKLRQLVHKPRAVDGVRRAQSLWVIAASTGGPDAVVEFLRGVPSDLDGVALVYVQHIENSGYSNLCQVMAKHTAWPVLGIETAMVVREKTIYVVSPEHQFELSDAGVISPLHQPWGGRYRPSIDQVIAKVARAYRAQAGAIIFSGMGDDGASSANLLHHRGGKVWIQTPASCTIDSMPVSAQKKGCVTFAGEPTALAQQFALYHRRGGAKALS